MIWAQIRGGGKMHLALEAGEKMRGEVLRDLSPPLCGARLKGDYRMVCNLPLGHACKNCLRVWRSWWSER
jgi:hypothetical protein